MLSASRIGVVVSSKSLLDDVSLMLAPGEVVVVLGPNGAGKSTLLNCLSGTLTPTTGSVTLDGHELRTLERRALARRRSVVAQTNVVTMPVYAEEIVALGRVPHGDGVAQGRAIVAGAMMTADADDFIGRLVPTLSGGEQQRVHLARALAQIWPEASMLARYVLLDEPTSNLDLSHQARLMSTARALAGAGYGVLAILHDLNLAGATADRLVVLERGRVAAEGTPATVLQSEIIERVFELPVDIVARPDGRGPLVVPRLIEHQALPTVFGSSS